MMALHQLLLASALTFIVVAGFRREPCTRAMQSQFQLPDCFVPPMDTSILLSEASFLLSHDAATGYISRGTLKTYPKGKIAAAYSKNQVGTAYDQLNDGARALDVRPKLLNNGTVVLQHGDLDISWVSLDQLVSDAVRWCAENPDELVLIFHADLHYESWPEYDEGATWAAAATSAYSNLGVPYVQCGDVYGLTVAETMELAALPGGGYLLAMDRQDYYGSFCGKSNWLPDSLVTCYPKWDSKFVDVRCTTGPNSKPMTALMEYVLASANNEATDDYSALGPPADLEYYPFNEIQGLWQVDTHSAVNGMAHGSTLLDDNRNSDVNAELVDLIYSGAFNGIGLFAVDNVALNGNALLSVLRTQCGQSTLADCDQELSKPKMKHMRRSKTAFALILTAFEIFCIWGAFQIWKHQMPRSLTTKEQKQIESGSYVLT